MRFYSFRNNGMVLLLLMITFISGCGKTHRSNGTIIVPEKDNIPHYHDSFIAVKKSISFNKLPDKTPILVRLNSFFSHPEKFKLKKLPVLSIPQKFISLNGNRMLLLDIRRNQLLEYETKTDSVQIIASSGHGPGDLLFAGDMTHKGDMVFVTQNMQISRFDCRHVPCVYSGTTELHYMPYSVALPGDSMAVFGVSTKMMRGFKSLKVEMDLSHLKIVHVFNSVGKQVASFGDTYQTGGYWMLFRPFIYDGVVRYNTSRQSYFLAYKNFPFIYEYGNHFQLRQVYKIPDFVMPKMKYNIKKGQLFNPTGTYSAIQSVRQVSNNDILLGIKTVVNLQYNKKSHEMLRGYRYDYYVLDLKNNKNYFAGELKLKRSPMFQGIYVTANQIVRVKDGNLYLVEDK